VVAELVVLRSEMVIPAVQVVVAVVVNQQELEHSQVNHNQ
jgi:hypothetical protein